MKTFCNLNKAIILQIFKFLMLKIAAILAHHSPLSSLVDNGDMTSYDICSATTGKGCPEAFQRD